MQILKKLIVFVFMVNVFVAPINLFMIYRYSKIVLLSDDYNLKKVKILKIVPIEFSGSGHQNSQGWSIGYFINNQTKYVSIEKGFDSYNHFIYSGKKSEVFESHLTPKVNDSIWIWHNPKAKDFYALGEKDTFKTERYWLKTILHLLLLLIAIWSINYHIRYNKKRTNET
mgnify:FL=1|tara:strand:- start:63033 stop:63542 length:510 start_codon:yes stop_codon:yes gene_type:complete